MESIGCTTPFGVNINNICSEQTKSKQALDLFIKLVDKKFRIKECPYPCTIVRSLIKPGAPRPSNTNGLANKYVHLNFDKFIKVTKARYSYTELELLAEFGGYVGLFLGLSVFSIHQLFDVVVDSTIKTGKTKKRKKSIVVKRSIQNLKNEDLPQRYKRPKLVKAA